MARGQTRVGFTNSFSFASVLHVSVHFTPDTVQHAEAGSIEVCQQKVRQLRQQIPWAHGTVILKRLSSTNRNLPFERGKADDCDSH